MVSLERYCSIKKLTQASINSITTAGTSELANKRLLRMMTCTINSQQEDTLLNFCSNLEVVIGSSNVIEQLRKGIYFVTRECGTMFYLSEALLCKLFCSFFCSVVLSNNIYCRFGGGYI